MNEPKENKESVIADASEVVGEVAVDGIIEGAFEIAGGVAETVIGGAGEIIGGLIDGI